MKVVAFLPAKGSSDRVQNKNTKLLNGKPLFLYTLEKLVKCEFIDEVYLDSDSDEILNYASYLNYYPLKREASLATNKTDGHQLFFNEVRQVEADIYIQILGTSPFIKPKTIKNGIDILMQHQEWDSVVLVKKEKQYTWNELRPDYDIENIPNSNTLPDTIIETMGLYILKSDVAHKLKRRIGNKPYLMYAESLEGVDINYADDFVLADLIARGINEKEVSKFSQMSQQLSSSLLSDILWDYHIKTNITGLHLNLPNMKILGRASTLKLKKLSNDEDFKGIYNGLQTYSQIRSGNVILVENECAENAYFGELNCNLAIRSGAIATVINGVTRDIVEVNNMNYPVFSKGYCCSDVRGIATVESFNKKIYINDVPIYPEDLIFGDINGVIVIPQKYEKEVLQRAMLSMKTEKDVIYKIFQQEDAFSIYKELGAF